MKKILFGIVALVGLGLAASPAMAAGHFSRRVVCLPTGTPTCLPTVTTCSPAPVIVQPCAPTITTTAPACAPVCAPVCAPTVYYHTSYRHFGGWGHVRYSRRCR
jgi:hypothetical protein